MDKSDDAVELLATGNPQVELMREENKTARGKISKLERMLAVVLESQAALLEGVTVLRNSITDQTRMSVVYTPKNSRTPSPKKTTTPDMLGTAATSVPASMMMSVGAPPRSLNDVLLGGGKKVKGIPWFRLVGGMSLLTKYRTWCLEGV